MSELPALVSDLAMILIVAGATTLLFKWLKQPLVLGYIVAGMLAGPAIALFSVQDTGNVRVWSDIGVLFLLFSLGLEFSFKKLLSVGKTGIFTALTEAAGMMVVGFLVGTLMGWGVMNSLFLGGMISISSTTIVIKAFDDMNLQRKKYAGLVFGVLVVEDLVAVVLMVLLSTIATAGTFSAWSILSSIFRLVFFLTLWFVFGIFLIPTLLKKTRPLMNEETLLVVCVGLCLSMVILAVKAGFSSALGAFIMGSMMAETTDVLRIEKITKPLKDLFGAVFFVSVGMMVNLSVLVEYAGPILLLTFIVLFLKSSFATFGMILSGQPLKISVQSGMCLSQIGEFSFIIAGLGLSLKVTGEFLYPVAVTVSVITTFLSPYFMRLSTPVGKFLLKHIPDKWHDRLMNGKPTVETFWKGNIGDWMIFLKDYLMNLLLNLVIILGILLLSMRFLEPFLLEYVTTWKWASIMTTAVTLLVASPFLKALIGNRKKSSSGAVLNLWTVGRKNQIVINLLLMLRLATAFFLIAYILGHFLSLPVLGIVPIAALLLFVIFRSRKLMRTYLKFESRFLINLNERQLEENNKAIQSNHGIQNSRNVGEGHWLDRILYSFAMRVGECSSLKGNALKGLSLPNLYKLVVVRVERKGQVTNMPSGDFVLETGDVVVFAGYNDTMKLLRDESLDLSYVQDSLMTLHDFSKEESNHSDNVLCCSGLPISASSPIAGKMLCETDISRKKCMVIGYERADMHKVNPKSDHRIEVGDLLWIVGEESAVSSIIRENVYLL